MQKLTSVQLDKVDFSDGYFKGYAWLTVNGVKDFHAYIEGSFKLVSIAGEKKPVIQAIAMDEIGYFDVLTLNTADLEYEIETEMQNYDESYL